MKTHEEIPTTLTALRGIRVRANYIDPKVPHYRENPLIAALPPIPTNEQVMQQLSINPPYSPEDRNLPIELRLHCVDTVTQFIQPLTTHIDLEQRISRIIRSGYVGRNPVDIKFQKDINQHVGYMGSGNHLNIFYHSNTCGFAIIGISGIGKTTAIKVILSLYPQVIFHHEYLGKPFSCTQVVWLKLECPGDGSLRGLCLSFFQEMDHALDTNYYKYYTQNGRASVDSLIPSMARLAAIHGLGVLVVDEVQNLSEAYSGGEKRILNHLVELENYIGIPVILLGTYKALPVLGGNEFRQARRLTSEGDFVWDPMEFGDEWQLFTRSLGRYQYTNEISDLSRKLSWILYDVSQGITDIAVKVYKLAQIHAIQIGRERVDEAIIQSVAHTNLRLVEPALLALRNRDPMALNKFEDLYPKWKMQFNKCLRINPIKLQVDETQPISCVQSTGVVEPQSIPDQLQKISTEKAGRKQKKSIQTPVLNNEGGLRKIVESGMKSKTPAYESLMNAGRIQPYISQ